MEAKEENIVVVAAEEKLSDNSILPKSTGSREGESDIFDVLINGKKVAEAFDANPLYIETDDSCREYLLSIKEDLPLTKSEIDLIDQSLLTLSANNGDDVVFGPVEIIEFGSLAEKYPSHTSEILACSHYLTESVDCEGEIPQGIFVTLAQAHGALANMLSFGLKAGDAFNFNDEDDDEFEEEISDDE